MPNNSSIKCKTCNIFFHSRGERDSHIDRLHRAFISVKFKDDVVRIITRNSDGLFECGCGHTYARGRAVARHSKLCNGSPSVIELPQGRECETSTVLYSYHVLTNSFPILFVIDVFSIYFYFGTIIGPS
jgi:hypothetical protein